MRTAGRTPEFLSPCQYSPATIRQKRATWQSGSRCAKPCDGWTARRDGDRLELAGQGERIDGLRALCAAAWATGHANQEGVSEDAVRDAVGRLGRDR